MTEPEGRHRSSAESSTLRDLAEDATEPQAVEPADDAVETPAELDELHREEREDIGRPPPRWKALLLTPSNGVWAGLVVVAAGFSAIFYSWGAVAGTINVDEQMASLISWGLTGLGFVVVGVAAVDVAVRLQDRPERQQQVAQVERCMAELRDVNAGRSRSYY
ncbi:MAG: hypothetical protein GEV04_17470 [Actinophytocola sp.]|nr:hypothetical protein [Actinophytocola sp.]